MSKLIENLAVGAAVITAGIILEKSVERAIIKMKFKDTDDVLKMLNTDTEEDRSDVVAFFINKDIVEIENNGFTYMLCVMKEKDGISDKEISMLVRRKGKRVFHKTYSAKEWKTEVRDKVYELINK